MLRCHAALSLDVISKSWCGHGLGRLIIISLSCHSVPVWSWASILVLWGLDSCLYTEILSPHKVQHPDTAWGRSQVKATSCYSKHHSAITDSMIFVPCSIRKTVPGSCIRGKERNFITVNPFALCLNATENQMMGEKWVNRTSAEARSRFPPAPLFLLQQHRRVCKLSAGSSISDKQISALLRCFRSPTGCGHLKAARSLHHHPAPCAAEALGCSPKSALLLYLSRLITRRRRVQLLLDTHWAPAS